ncbi:hypothetical protein DNAM5_81 [Haloarcula californiae tailed virus 1]|uniref:Uncharacterized protein n=1 Tax=Haloarcula californiae tailed virus 1 TaxID=1273746 RepID=R4T8B3_9CAUD|nr:hypothetical protein M202_gp059 [Haloarcula californiae tailed virus 1]AGM12019.1 hypothetical protein DNAM5_81 [Haloarcula californiae tailed virus 1]
MPNRSQSSISEDIRERRLLSTFTRLLTIMAHPGVLYNVGEAPRPRVDPCAPASISALVSARVNKVK